VDMRVRVHQGTPSTETTSPALDQDDSADLITASLGSQQDFDDAVDDVGGLFEVWYEALTSTHQGEVREALKGMHNL